MADLSELEARRHLSPEILRTVDRSGIRYSEMEPGQPITIFAQDAITNEQGSFLLRVISVRDDENHRNKDVTFEYIEGDFNFHVHSNKDQDRTTQLNPGALLETGVTATFVPATDYRMVYMGGIGVGRDHSFEYIDGEDLTVVAHNITALEQGETTPDFKTPDISEHLEKVRAAEKRASENERVREERVRRVVMEDLEQYFGEDPRIQDIKDLIAGYSPNGQLVMSSFLIYGQEDGVLDQAWASLQEADRNHFSYEHPDIRGDLDFKASSRGVYINMLKDTGITWPRPEPESKDLAIVLPDERKAQLTVKLEEYRERLDSDREPIYRMDSIHKIYVLERLLADGNVSPSELEQHVVVDLGQDFDRESFERALWVMKEYCKDGGKNLPGGTGLPQV